MKSSGNNSKPTPEIDLAAVIDACRSDTGALSDLQAVYDAADAAAAEADLRCMGGGGCCHFRLFGHRLYVTGLELAQLVSTAPTGPILPDRCPYQIGPRCTAYDRRPLGCRTFFCKAIDDGPAGRHHESLHGRVKKIHGTRCIQYYYTDLCDALARLSNR